ncbi:hypothetical protein [Paraburkholderia mimosarum]|uniref:hypothetical protein n=1 Tax=Paraburkholderia mimosarum TaxID=312026 RepID=UPI0012DE7D5E|nr:hypothetical protein [Paraburkholderia mimosarum]
MKIVAAAVACALATVARNAEGGCAHPTSAYTFVVAETTASEIGVSIVSVADDRHSAVFLRPYTLPLLLWSGLGEGALAHAGSHGRRYANLALCPATPIGVGDRVYQPVRGGRYMRQALARPEQLQSSVLEIISAALRIAALAPSDRDALDVTGDALRLLAELARTEARPHA